MGLRLLILILTHGHRSHPFEMMAWLTIVYLLVLLLFPNQSKNQSAILTAPLAAEGDAKLL